MHVSTLLRDYAQYNYWANQRIVNWLQTKPAELLTTDIASSFSNIQKTLLHNYGAEYLWLQRLQGVSPASFPGQQFDGTPDELFAMVLDASAKLRDFVLQQEDTYLDNTLDYKQLNGNAYNNQAAYMIQHCLQHSTFHRGQIVTMGRSLGLTDPPSTDFIVYVREYVV